MPTFTSCIKSHDSSALRALRRFLLLLCLVLFASAQEPLPFPEHPHEKETPADAAAIESMLKARHEKNMKDLEKIARLVEDVQTDTRKNSRYIVSLQSLKDLEQIEKLSKRIRERMKR